MFLNLGLSGFFFVFFFHDYIELMHLGKSTTVKMLVFSLHFKQEVFDDAMTHFTGGFNLDHLM